MNDLSHILMSLSYTPSDPRVPEEMRKAAAEIERLNSELTDALTDLDSARQDNASLTPYVQELRATNERLRAALEPFGKAWEVATQTDAVRFLTLGQLGALAGYEVSGTHFQRANAALAEEAPCSSS